MSIKVQMKTPSMRSGSSFSSPEWSYKIMASSAIILVNLVSFAGLLTWAHRTLPSFQWIGQIAFSLALESVSVFLQHLAFHAEIKLMPSFRLKWSSKLWGLMVGILNATAFMNGGRYTREGIAIGILSTSSPWLWQAYAKQVGYAIM